MKRVVSIIFASNFSLFFLKTRVILIFQRTNVLSAAVSPRVKTNEKLTALEFRLCEDFQAAWKIHVTVSAFLKDSDSQLRKSVCS